MRTVHLVRHGSHDEVGHVLSGRSEIGLNAAGRAESARLAAHLAATPIAAIWSSPRRRTRETAAILAEGRGIAITLADGLDEIDFGEWTGRRFADLEGDPCWHAWNGARGGAAVPGGETMAGAVARARRCLDALPAEGAALCVSHCDVIRGLAAACLGLSLDRLLAFDCDPASVTTLALGDGGGRVVALNMRPA